MFTPRPKQAEVLAYTGGRMGVSAVPGSGKTQTLSALAARLVAEGGLADDQEVLIVTLVNSAVDNFARRVNEFVTSAGCCRTSATACARCTAWRTTSCASGRRWWAGRTTSRSWTSGRRARSCSEAAEAWLAAHPDAADAWLRSRAGRAQARLGPPRALARAGRRSAPALHPPGQGPAADPGAAAGRAGQRRPEPTRLCCEMGCIYADYQRALAYRGAVDYDDLIRLALLALELDGEYLKRLRTAGPTSWRTRRRTAAGCRRRSCACCGTGTRRTGNWVRVGDPNQAIFETFTTASPQLPAQLPGRGGRDRPRAAQLRPLDRRASSTWRTTWWTGRGRSTPCRALRDALAPARHRADAARRSAAQPARTTRPRSA